ncbi:uncharacterized protein EKO05_0011135 [Ascochyta rabiei]|uniref:ATP binding n=1 Tax=Didymella rabiei TaxID=5454 RepID=A0A163A7D7_DIDRA|nr:uncharacterized protein EKO05_0011135 [Ascochyta rabiei]KZM21028.1 ATP binding [Ascochyta rabiei]UPX20925.1 hypothetical protein EKO05_0011135 [Ascochyta rabiei]
MADQDGPPPPRPAPWSHRLPTVSASQALQSLHARGARTVPTGLGQLDRLLAPRSLPGHDARGGYARGKVTEVYGPPGVGKTSLLLQAASNALDEGQRVYWIDAACAPLVPQRLHEIRQHAHPNHPSELSPHQLRSHFHHLAAPTLAHILALFMHPPPSFPHPGASLVVIDSLSTLIDNAYPRNPADRIKNKTDQSKWAAGRRYSVINDLIAAFTNFAALHHVALLVTCQTITRIRGPSRALLVPAIAGLEWENGIATRLLLFRDWLPQQPARLQNARFAALVKLNGLTLADEGGVGNVVPFAIERHGLRDLDFTLDHTATTMVLPIQPRPPKRTFDELDENVSEEPNSDQAYGWIEDDGLAADGLLIQDPPTMDGLDAPQEPAAEGRSTKVMRTSTV